MSVWRLRGNTRLCGSIEHGVACRDFLVVKSNAIGSILIIMYSESEEERDDVSKPRRVFSPAEPQVMY